jgi:hypothetical protein
MEIEKTYLLKKSLQALIDISARRTSRTYVDKVMNRIISVFQQTYPFLYHVDISDGNQDGEVNINGSLEEVGLEDICEVLGSFIRVLFMDLGDEMGLYFVKEFKQRVEPEIISILEQSGINLSIIEVEQRHVFTHHQEQKNAKIAGDVSLLGYTWDEVSNWKYDEMNNVCILYDKNDQVLDKLNLDAIIENHVKRLTGEYNDEDMDFDFDSIKLEPKDNELLHLFEVRKHSKTIDVVMASALLQMPEDEIEQIIERLVKQELLSYANVDTIQLSEKGIQFISKTSTFQDKE